MAYYKSRVQEVDQKPASNKKLKRPTNQNKEKAQDLIYQAYMEKGTFRAQLAQQARDLDPYNVDAYTILSETSLYTKDALNLAKRGMEIGAEELGKSYFKENKGYFWGLSETRPFMRAKQNYASCLMEDGQTKEAIRQYEELLELNPMDNQGVRYQLMEAYITNEDPGKAKILLEKYPEETAHTIYNTVLIEYLANGKTLKLKQLIKDAKKVNPHVVNYLVGKKEIPMTLPESYGIGDKEEAIMYADDFIQYWIEHPELLKLLK